MSSPGCGTCVLNFGWTTVPKRAETSTLWIEAVSPRGATGYGESCPRPYVTGETLDTAREFFWRHEAALRRRAGKVALEGLAALLERRQGLGRNDPAVLRRGGRLRMGERRPKDQNSQQEQGPAEHTLPPHRITPRRLFDALCAEL